MSIERLKQYANPMKGPNGEARSQDNLDYWSDRASANSKIAPRASDGPMKLPSTGKQTVRDTTSKPYASRKVDAHMKAKDDVNYVGSSRYMREIRRDA